MAVMIDKEGKKLVETDIQFFLGLYGGMTKTQVLLNLYEGVFGTYPDGHLKHVVKESIDWCERLISEAMKKE